MKRIAIGQLQQETNSLNPQPSSRLTFEESGLAFGKGILDKYGSMSELAGFMTLPDLLQEDIDWVELVRAKHAAGGPIDDSFLDEMVTYIRKCLDQQELDGVILSLHGALASPNHPDVEGYVLSQIREIVGPDVPVVATLDLHANITPQMIKEADVLVGYHTFPHVDHLTCGQRGAKALAQLITTGKTPKVSAVKIPMVVNTKGFTTVGGVLDDIYSRVVEAESEDGVLSVGLYMAQPWLDVPELGWTLYQAYEGDNPPLGPESTAAECWERRVHNKALLPSPEEAIEQMLADEGHPMAVSEGHDATNSGAPGDSTRLLSALLKYDIPEAGALTFCIDPASVAQCASTGVNSTVELSLGGVIDPYSEPLKLTAQILKLQPLVFIYSGHGGHNLQVNMGNSAVVRSGTTTIVIVEQAGTGGSPKVYETVGLDPKEYKIVVAKSPEGFRYDYEPFAAGIYYCGAPGCASANLRELTFKQASRPLFPLDDMEKQEEASWIWTYQS